MKEYKFSEEARKHMSLSKKGNTWHFGKTGVYSDATLARWSMIRTGRTQLSEVKAKISKALMGHKVSEETRQKIRIANSGSNGSGWIDGRASMKYPAMFNKKIKQEIKQRDDFRCQLCGRSEGWCKEKYGVGLSINHIDFNKKNCAKENLNALCSGCNTYINWHQPTFKKYFSAKLQTKLLTYDA